MKDLLKIGGLLAAYVLIRIVLSILGEIIAASANRLQVVYLEAYLGRNFDEAGEVEGWLEIIHGVSREALDLLSGCKNRIGRALWPQPLVVR